MTREQEHAVRQQARQAANSDDDLGRERSKQRAEWWVGELSHKLGIVDSKGMIDVNGEVARAFVRAYMRRPREVWPTPDTTGVRETRKSSMHTPQCRSPRVVADFNTLDDLISHAARDLGATHASGDEANTKLYFPRGGQFPYEEATVWRKNGYWHAQGPSARTGIARLPSDARSIGGRSERRAAEAPNSDVIHVAPGIEVRRMGSIERGANYRMVDGWAVVVDGRPWQPWMIKSEAMKLAKKVAAERKGTGVVKDYIAVDRRGKTIAGPFKTYGPAKDAAGTAGTVQYVRAGVEARAGGTRGGPARKYWIVEQSQYGLWAQVGRFHSKAAAERFAAKVPGKVQVVHAYPSGHNHPVQKGVGTTEARRAPRGAPDPLEQAKAAGAAYAEDQINGDHFRDWVREQLHAASRMDPSERLPLETNADAMVIARNMFQDLEWDTKRQMDNRDLAALGVTTPEEARAFYTGFKEILNSSRDWLADELLEIKQEMDRPRGRGAGGTTEAHRGPEQDPRGDAWSSAKRFKLSYLPYIGMEPYPGRDIGSYEEFFHTLAEAQKRMRQLVDEERIESATIEEAIPSSRGGFGMRLVAKFDDNRRTTEARRRPKAKRSARRRR